MKVSAYALASSLVICHSDAFSVVSSSGNPRSAPRCVALAAEKSKNNLKADFAKGAASFAAAVAIGWGVTNGVNAAEMLPDMQPSLSAESSSVMVSVGEYADFSMPSYRNAIDAPIMTNLKGEKMVEKENLKFAASEDDTTR
jgi:hypothetical protein